MRMAVVALGAVLALAPAGRAVAGNGADVGLAFGAAASNLVYTPVKVVMALGGLAVGGVVGALNGGDVRSAYAIWVPAAGGDYYLTPAKLEGSDRFDVFGTEYADKPSLARRHDDGSSIYDALYERER